MTVSPGTVVAPGHAVHRRGTDHRAGDLIVPAGTFITPGYR